MGFVGRFEHFAFYRIQILLYQLRLPPFNCKFSARGSTKAIGKSCSSGKIFRRPSVGTTRKYEFGSAVLLIISRSEKNFWARKFASDIVLGFWASEQTWNSLLRYSKGLSFDDTEYWWMSCDFLKIFSSLWIRLAWCKSKNVTVQRYYSLTICKVFCLLLYLIYN